MVTQTNQSVYAPDLVQRIVLISSSSHVSVLRYLQVTEHIFNLRNPAVPRNVTEVVDWHVAVGVDTGFHDECKVIVHFLANDFVQLREKLWIGHEVLLGDFSVERSYDEAIWILVETDLVSMEMNLLGDFGDVSSEYQRHVL